MTDNQEHHRESIAKIALLLALGGVLVPLLLSMLTVVVPGIHLTDDQAHMFLYSSVGFGLIAETFAVVLGIAGWTHLYGKVAVGCAATVLLLVLGVFGSYTVAWQAPTRQSEIQAQPAGPAR
jgi:hypothetical protein